MLNEIPGRLEKGSESKNVRNWSKENVRTMDLQKIKISEIKFPSELIPYFSHSELDFNTQLVQILKGEHKFIYFKINPQLTQDY